MNCHLKLNALSCPAPPPPPPPPRGQGLQSKSLPPLLEGLNISAIAICQLRVCDFFEWAQALRHVLIPAIAVSFVHFAHWLEDDAVSPASRAQLAATAACGNHA